MKINLCYTTTMKKYSLREPVPQDIEESLKVYHPMVRALLHARGIADGETAEKFLNPNYDTHLHDPFLLKNMDKVVKRILKAIEKNEKVCIYSDYDCECIPGAVVLHDFFKKIGFNNFINYIPMRNEEGYGLNQTAIESIIADGVTLIITIDCGITDYAHAEFTQSQGIDLIITDHHIPGEEVPKAFAVINPKQKGCDYPEKMICGSGVIFKVVQALIKSGKVAMPEGHEKWLLDMVGLATLSDMVPLQGENRVFSYYGMKVLRKSPRVGLMKMFSSLKINQHTVREDDIAFMITPRINAASRMGIPRDAFTLLSTTDEVEAGTYTEHLNKNNDARKGVVVGMVKDIKKYIENAQVYPGITYIISKRSGVGVIEQTGQARNLVFGGAFGIEIEAYRGRDTIKGLESTAKIMALEGMTYHTQKIPYEEARRLIGRFRELCPFL